MRNSDSSASSGFTSDLPVALHPRKPERLLCQPKMLAVHGSDLDAAASKGHTSGEYSNAVKETNTSDEHPLRKFYKTQGLQYLGEENDRVSVPIWSLPCQPRIFLAVHGSDLDAAASKGHTSGEFANAVKETNTSDEHPLRKFYKTQSLQYLGEENDRVSVPIWIAGYDNSSSEFEDVASSWIEHIQRAISDINDAVPGLNLHTVSEKSNAIIKIAGNQRKSCFTRGRILSGGSSKIYLYSGWNNKKRTSCHELLHALGFGHEHQRPDRDYSIEIGSNTSQYKKLDDLYGVTRFDPYSIMLYPEDEKYLRRSGDPVWFTKPSHELNLKMSELDKVGVNNLYRPCKRSGYSPVIGSTGLFYCGRYIGVQSPGHDGHCGPNNGVNCPACRTLKTGRVVSLWERDKWQGWTGAIYCGYFFGVQCEGHDGYCGPNNGPQCPECYKEFSLKTPSEAESSTDEEL